MGDIVLIGTMAPGAKAPVLGDDEVYNAVWPQVGILCEMGSRWNYPDIDPLPWKWTAL